MGGVVWLLVLLVFMFWLACWLGGKIRLGEFSWKHESHATSKLENSSMSASTFKTPQCQS
jgi:hypothetical protein